ncbi:MAG TPA: hypothetical protein PLI43_18950 [Albidovulum sp.]|uniref:hypothetical protein n=1 Tax=Albidovulum sp. TaxID=1872424 RepID=UPI002BCA1EDD|nr:hypothetical protein [Albidovulum sp.]
MLGFLAAALWAAPPLGFRLPGASGGAAFANQGGSESGSGGSGNDDDDDDGSGGGGNSGPGGLSGSSGSGKGKGKPGKAGATIGTSRRPIFGGDGIHLQFFDGHVERLRAGQFERTDKAGRIIERRVSTAGDLRRLRSLEAEFAAKGRASGIVTVAEIDERSGRVEITDFRGWRETLIRARYELSDPNGRTVTLRALVTDDIQRVRSLLSLN